MFIRNKNKNRFMLSFVWVVFLGGVSLSLEASDKLAQGLNDAQGQNKKSHFARNVGLGAISLGALAATSYGLYWANDYDLKKTLKPAIQLSFVGTLMTAGYLCAGKFVLGAMVKTARKEIGSLGELLQNMIKNAAQTTNDVFITKFESIKDLIAFYFAFYKKRMNPFNMGKSDVSLEHEIKNELADAKEKEILRDTAKKQEDNKTDGKGTIYGNNDLIRKSLFQSGYFSSIGNLESGNLGTGNGDLEHQLVPGGHASPIGLGVPGQNAGSSVKTEELVPELVTGDSSAQVGKDPDLTRSILIINKDGNATGSL